MTDVLTGALVFLVGASIGSFLNVCIARWPAELSVVTPRSRCPKCERPVRWHENLPIASWLLLRGRCRGCREAISPQYLVVELLVALGWLAAMLAFGPSFTALRVAVFGTVLAGIAITDARHYLIPDGFTVFGLLWTLATAVAALLLGEPSALFASPADAFLGACAGAGLVSIVGWLGEVALKKEAMGFGDVTLMAVVGAAVGPWRALLTVFVGAALAAVIFLLVVYPIAWVRGRRRGTPFEPPLVPFGVFLAPAAFLTLLWGNDLIAWYLGYLSPP
ncbi:MAG TPA: prepilin peptidase [Gemmatimonadaceae bacterium]|nr:prepilin peptidase [Gemmatimonadaceae bacterium]